MEYITLTKTQLDKGTGEVLDFEGWDQHDYKGFKIYIETMDLNHSKLSKIKLRNINEHQMEIIKKILKKDRRQP